MGGKEFGLGFAVKVKVGEGQGRSNQMRFGAMG